MKTTILCFLLFCLALGSCKKKDDPPVLSSSKLITSFQLQPQDNTGIIATPVSGAIGKDTIVLSLPEGTETSHLTPTISFSGVSLSPTSEAEQNFTSPAIYTITAQDGSTKKYVVVARYLSSKKDITSFIFTAAANPGLSSDITGIISNDSIVVRTPLLVSTLTPTIVYTGKSISPGAGASQDFSNTVSYTVTAEDGTLKTYHVFVSTNVMVYTMSTDGYLYALDAASGGLMWKYEVYPGGAAGFPPTFSNGRVYVSGRHLLALDGATGAKLWENAQSAGGTLPIVAGGRVYGMSTVPLTSPDNGTYSTYNFAAFDAATGSLLWQQYVFQVKTLPFVAEGKAYIGSLGYGFYGFDTATGAPAWKLDAGIVNGNPAYSNGSIYTGGEWSHLGVYSAATGKEEWTYPLSHPIDFVSPTLSGDLIIYSYGDTIYEVSASSHQAVLSIPLPSQRTAGNPFLTNGTLYVGASGGILYAFDAATGKQKWMAGSGLSGGATKPVVANNTVYAGMADNYFYAYDAATGAVKWRFPMGSNPGFGACVTDVQGHVYHPVESGEQN